MSDEDDPVQTVIKGRVEDYFSKEANIKTGVWNIASVNMDISDNIVLGNLNTNVDIDMEFELKEINLEYGEFGTEKTQEITANVAGGIFDYMTEEKEKEYKDGDRDTYIDYYTKIVNENSSEINNDVFVLVNNAINTTIINNLFDPCGYHEDEDIEKLRDPDLTQEEKLEVALELRDNIMEKAPEGTGECERNADGEINWPDTTVSATIKSKLQIEAIIKAYYDAFNSDDFLEKAVEGSKSDPDPDPDQGKLEWWEILLIVIACAIVGGLIVWKLYELLERKKK